MRELVTLQAFKEMNVGFTLDEGLCSPSVQGAVTPLPAPCVSTSLQIQFIISVSIPAALISYI